MAAKLILFNGKIRTLDEKGQEWVTSVAIGEDGNFQYVGSDQSALEKFKGSNTEMIDLKGRVVVPGLNDSHLHIIRAALYYNLELRWDGVPSLKIALQMLRDQAKRTPPGQWVRVVGGWSIYQFEEKRYPTLDEINEATGDVPCFILYLYGLAFINKAAIKAINYTKDTKYAGGEVQLDANGEPTGLLIAKPSALILYSTLGLAPRLGPEDQKNSTLHYYRELNRLGLTSSIDPGGGGQHFPDHYENTIALAREGKLTIRTAYFLFAQVKDKEVEDFKKWVKVISPGQNDDPTKGHGFCMCGAGENIVWSAADFENFLEPRPELAPHMESQLTEAIELFVKNRWPFRIHATYNESISRFLDVFEAVNKKYPFNGLHWLIDHAETVSDTNLDRIKALGGGIAIQNRMFFQGESFMQRYGRQEAASVPPISKMIAKGIPIGLGTDGTRVSSYNPWLSLYWIVSGKCWSGELMYGPNNILSRERALYYYTKGSAWISMEDELKGIIANGQYGDLIALSKDYFTCPEEDIKDIHSVLTVVNGSVVHAEEEFASLNPAIPEVSPSWSPIKYHGGYFVKR
jgi:predicted amidohydrolase YtcJ